MTYREVKADLFEYHYKGYCLAHCISADFKLGAGIAKEFEKRYKLRNDLLDWLGGEWYSKIYMKGYGYAIFHDRHNVIDLVTKERYWHKPTLQSLRIAVERMRELCDYYNISKIAMPKIGCGLDKLNWKEVRSIIKDVFKDTNIDIVICYL